MQPSGVAPGLVGPCTGHRKSRTHGHYSAGWLQVYLQHPALSFRGRHSLEYRVRGEQEALVVLGLHSIAPVGVGEASGGPSPSPLGVAAVNEPPVTRLRRRAAQCWPAARCVCVCVWNSCEVNLPSCGQHAQACTHLSKLSHRGPPHLSVLQHVLRPAAGEQARVAEKRLLRRGVVSEGGEVTGGGRHRREEGWGSAHALGRAPPQSIG